MTKRQLCWPAQASLFGGPEDVTELGPSWFLGVPCWAQHPEILGSAVGTDDEEEVNPFFGVVGRLPALLVDCRGWPPTAVHCDWHRSGHDARAAAELLGQRQYCFGGNNFVDISPGPYQTPPIAALSPAPPHRSRGPTEAVLQAISLAQSRSQPSAANHGGRDQALVSF